MSSPPAWIDLDGAVNVRDLAGLTTADGATVQPHRLIRADNLQDLSPSDVRRLVEDHGVRTIADLRTGVEVSKEGPGPILAEPDVTRHHLSLIPEAGRTTDVAAGQDGASTVLPWQTTRDEVANDVARRGAGAVYLRYLEDRGDNVVEALRVIARSPGATMVHCAAGKDRTGTVVALALDAVGVERDAITADYARSAERIEQILTRLIASPTYVGDLGGTTLAEVDVDRQRPRAETMAAFLAGVDSEYGGTHAWLRAHGWTDRDDAALRAKLLGLRQAPPGCHTWMASSSERWASTSST